MTLDEKFMIKDILLEYCAAHNCKNCNFDNKDRETNKCKLFYILYELSNCEVEQMLAKKCDLCGNFYDHYDGWRENEEEANAITFNDRGLDGRSTGLKLYDLCPECMNKILETIKNIKIANI